MSRTGITKLTILLCLAGATATGAYAQAAPPAPPVQPRPERRTAKPRNPARPIEARRGLYERGVSEKVLAVDADVNIKMPCISEARVSINGWDRNEVRVFVKDGTGIDIRTLEKDAASGKPNWVLITSPAATGGRFPGSECLSGDRVEIDVPMKASLTITGRETETSIDSVKKIFIKNLGGNVALRNITGGINAATFEGDVTVENSGGQISLETSTGNVIAYDVGPGDVGDTFSAKTTNGAITLQKVDHRQVDATSVSGSVIFNGKFRPGGLYNLSTANGSIKLAIPDDSSFKLVASYGFGTFNSTLPLTKLTENIVPGGKNLVYSLGSGDATVRVTTSSGSIFIGKL